MDDCIFCKIIAGKIPSKKVFEDEDVYAFHDIHPVAPVHFMIIPKKHVASLAELAYADQGVMGKIMVMASKLAKEQGCNNGFRAIVNTGEAARQDVFHLHVHIIGGEILPAMIVKSKH